MVVINAPKVVINAPKVVLSGNTPYIQKKSLKKSSRENVARFEWYDWLKKWW
jgi:ribosomal protein L13